MHNYGASSCTEPVHSAPMIRLAARARAQVTTVHHHPSNGRRRKGDDVLAQPHRATLTAEVELQTFDVYELEPAHVQERVELWLADHYAVNAGDATTQVVARMLLDQLRDWYGEHRGYRVEVLEGVDLGSTAELPWRTGPGRHPRPLTPE